MKTIKVICLLAAFIAVPSMAQSTVTPDTGSTAIASPVSAEASRPLSRTEVRADRNLWLRAGMAQFAGAESFVADTPQYQESLAHYRRMRQGPEYAAELQRLTEHSR